MAENGDQISKWFLVLKKKNVPSKDDRESGVFFCDN